MPTETDDLQALTTPVHVAGSSFRATIPDGWQQGRGAFGGLVVANLARAIESLAATPDRTLRSLTAEICGPTQPGIAEISVEPLRIGNGLSTLAARLVQRGEVQAHMVAMLGRARAEVTWNELSAPIFPFWRDVPEVPALVPFAR